MAERRYCWSYIPMAGWWLELQVRDPVFGWQTCFGRYTDTYSAIAYRKGMKEGAD